MKVIKGIAAIQDVADYFRCIGGKIGLCLNIRISTKGMSLIDKAKEK